MNKTKNKEEEILHNALKEIEKLEPYKNFKMGRVYKRDNKLYMYICASMFQREWGIFQRLTKDFKVYGDCTYIPLYYEFEKIDMQMNLVEEGYRKFKLDNDYVFLKNYI